MLNPNFPCECGHIREQHLDSVPQCIGCYCDYGYRTLAIPSYNHIYKADNLRYLENLL